MQRLAFLDVYKRQRNYLSDASVLKLCSDLIFSTSKPQDQDVIENSLSYKTISHGFVSYSIVLLRICLDK